MAKQVPTPGIDMRCIDLTGTNVDCKARKGAFHATNIDEHGRRASSRETGLQQRTGEREREIERYIFRHVYRERNKMYTVHISM